MTENYKLLIEKLDKFIRKYYTSQLIKGVLISITSIGLLYVLLNVIEYYFYLKTIPRTILFYSFLAFSLMVIYSLVFLPILKMLRFGKNISYDEAAELVGKHFNNIGDKLLNTLQLKKIGELNSEESELLIAGIEQKIREIKFIDFNLAIDFSINKKFLKYAILPIFIVAILLIFVPKVLTESSGRIINYNIKYERPEKYHIYILNEKLEVVQQDDFTLNIKVTGEEIPDEIFIEYQYNIYRLNKLEKNYFDYTFRNIQSNIKFSLYADSRRKNIYKINVFPKPIILSFETILDYPEYTRKSDETINNNGDIVIPEGSIVNWRFFTKDADKISFSIDKKIYSLDKTNSNVISFSKKILKSCIYSVKTENSYIKNKDSLNYKITSIPDAFPTIFINEIRDTILDRFLYFNGTISDDYGFEKLKFKYSIINDKEKIENSENIELNDEIRKHRFYYSIDFEKINIKLGDKLEYYFEVWDNDDINGSKSAKSRIMELKIPEIGEIEEKINKETKDIENILKQSSDESVKIKKQAEELIKKILNKDKLDWKEKEKIEEILEKQKDLKEKVNSAIEKIEKKNREEENIKKLDDRILEKQRKLEELFKKIMTDEIKELFEKIKEQLDKIDKDKIKELLDDIKMSNEDLEKELDKNLELFRQLEFEKMLNDAIDKLNKLSEKQDELAKKTKNKEHSKESLKEKQENIEEEFEEIKKELDELESKNNELENKHKMPNIDSEESEISEQIEQSKEMLNKNRMSKASGSQNKAAKNMKKMAEFLMSLQSSMMMEQQSEDINALREILENLLQVSFNQEDIIMDLKNTEIKDPNYINIIKKQNNISEDVEMIKDSLYALSKRQMKIEHFVNEEIKEIDRNLELSINEIDKRKISRAGKYQQYVMTHINNLALMLDEILKKMEEEQNMQNSMNGKGTCTKPGKSGSASSMKKLQQQLNKQLKRMKEGMNEGGQKGKKHNNRSMSEQFARMAAKQAEIRDKMQSYLEELKEQGINEKGLKSAYDEMEKTETELVNKILNQETINRQEQIITKLLKSEKAEIEREKEKKRKSNEAKNQKISNPLEYLEYKKIKEKETELLKTIHPKLRPFFRNKIIKYFYKFKNVEKEDEKIDQIEAK